jgi:hypothetical protein
MSTGLAPANASTGAPQPYVLVPTSLYSSGSCGVFATPVVALATGVSTIFTLFAARDVLGNNFAGMLLAVYPDAGGAPGFPPVFDALLSASMCWQQSGGTTNASGYGFGVNATAWPDTGTVMCNITNGVGLFGQSRPLQFPSLFQPAGLWGAHRGRAGVPLVAGNTYWVALSPPSPTTRPCILCRRTLRRRRARRRRPRSCPPSRARASSSPTTATLPRTRRRAP